MTQLYVDASVLLRLLFDEPRSSGLRVPLRKGTIMASSTIVEVETYRAVDRARLTGLLTDDETAAKNKELSEMLSRVHLVSVSDDIIEQARATFPVSVRALDAIHVATAQMLLREVGPVLFWTHDRRQATAATSRALDVQGAN